MTTASSSKRSSYTSSTPDAASGRLGAAIISPAALSILTTTFPEGRERNIALGAVAGVLLGGVLTDWLSWEWIFLPIGVLGFFITPLLLRREPGPAVARLRRAGGGARHLRG